jgi:hypothetical protein
MPELKHLVKRLLFSSIADERQLCAVSVDWQGEPLVLLQEGKPSRPNRDAGMDATFRWLNAPPKKHHLIYWRNGSIGQVTFENPTGLLTTAHVQPMGDGWLVAEARGGLARVFDSRGNLDRKLDLGDAIEHVNTTPDGDIWVGYFDEGVFGSGIGSEGLVCFDPTGTPIFRYMEFAKQHGLPFISDCYTLNVVGSSVYVSYYTDFPLVWIRDFQLQRVWNDFGPNKAIGIRPNQFVIFPAYDKPYLTVRSFESSDPVVWELIAPDGRHLSTLAGGPPETTSTDWYVPFQCVARHGRLYVYDEVGLYELV